MSQVTAVPPCPSGLNCSGPQTTLSRYNGHNQRYLRGNAAGQTVFTYAPDGYSVLAEVQHTLIGSTTVSNTTETVYLPTASGPMPVVALINGAPFAVYADHLNTPRRLTDAQGRPRWQWAFSGFGEQAAQSIPRTGLPTVSYSLRYPGQVDDGNGLFYNFNRFYDPLAGRYTNADPIGLDGGWNRFGYVGGNALGFTDPKGLETYICKRPLGGSPGSFAPPVLNHTYVCVGSGENITCGSTTAASGQLDGTILTGGPGGPTKPTDDYYKPDVCELRQGRDGCIESCIANELKKPTRPKYAIGPMGTDCQEYTEDVVSACEKRCVRR